MEDHLQTSLPLSALQMALANADPARGCCIIPIGACNTPAPIIGKNFALMEWTPA